MFDTRCTHCGCRRCGSRQLKDWGSISGVYCMNRDESDPELDDSSSFSEESSEESTDESDAVNSEKFVQDWPDDKWLPCIETKEQAFKSDIAREGLVNIERYVLARRSEFSFRIKNEHENGVEARKNAYKEVKKLIEAHYPVTLPDAWTEEPTEWGQLKITGEIKWRLWKLHEWAARKLRAEDVWVDHPVVERAMASPPFLKKYLHIPVLQPYIHSHRIVSYYDGTLLMSTF